MQKFNNPLKILVAGSNRDGNDKAKAEAIAIFREEGYTVAHTCEIYRSIEDSYQAYRAVLGVLLNSDIYYVVASDKGYVGNATAARLGYAYANEAMSRVVSISSHKLVDPDLQFYIERVLSPQRLIDMYREENTRNLKE